MGLTPAKRPSDTVAMLSDAPDVATDFVDAPATPLSLSIAVRRGRLALLVAAAVAVMIERFDRDAKSADDQKKLLDRYNSYSGNVASALGRALEIFVALMAQVLVLWLMTDSALAVNASWRLKITVLALGASVGFLLTNSLNALNVQVRELPVTRVMSTSDLELKTQSSTNVSTMQHSFSERTPGNPSANTILRSLVLPRSVIKKCSGEDRITMDQDSVAFGIPQRAWMPHLPQALPATTLRIDLKANTTNGTASQLPVNASVVADHLLLAAYTHTLYAPFDALTPFNLDSEPQRSPKMRKWILLENGLEKEPTARLARLLPRDPASSEQQDRAWFLAHTMAFVRAATSDEWLNASSLKRWTLDVSRINLTSSNWVDAVTMESEVVYQLNQSLSNEAQDQGSPTGHTLFEADNRYPDAQVHAYAACVNGEGTETLVSENTKGAPAFGSNLDCKSASTTSMLVFSSGRYLVADELNNTAATNLRVVYSSTFARVSWQLQNLSAIYAATCQDTESKCMGLDAPLADTNQRLLLRAAALPLEQLAFVRDTFVYYGVYMYPQQPLELVTVRRPTKVEVRSIQQISEGAANSTVRVKDLDGPANQTRVDRASWLGDVLLPHNIGVQNRQSKVACMTAYDSRVQNYVNNHLYMETTLQPAYTAAMFFLFQNGMARDVLPQDKAITATTLALDGNIQEMSVWLSVPKLNATLTLAGCGFLVAALVMALVRLHVMTGRQDHMVTVTTPHQIARVMVDDTAFPSLLLKRRVLDRDVEGDADQFVVDALGVRPATAKGDGKEETETSASV